MGLVVIWMLGVNVDVITEGAGLEFPAPLAPVDLLAPFGTATDPHRAPLLVAHHPFNVDAPRHVDLNILVVIIPLTRRFFWPRPIQLRGY